jgi:hypothetical protein
MGRRLLTRGEVGNTADSGKQRRRRAGGGEARRVSGRRTMASVFALIASIVSLRSR